MSFFDEVKSFPPDPVFGIAALYRKDPNPSKIDLSLGVYYDEELKPTVMRAVKRAEKVLLEKEETKIYLPQEGKRDFIEESKKLIFGEAFVKDNGEKLIGVQAVGGTGALRLGGDFLRKGISKKCVLSDPTWSNHHGIFDACGLDKEIYPYYDKKSARFSLEAFLDYLKTLPKKSVVILHTCCHNPTGCDPTLKEWEMIEETIAKHQLIPFFDTAYLGFAKDIEADNWPIRYFAKKGHELFVALSFSKSFSLYAERVGAFFTLTQDKKSNTRLSSVINRLIRVNYSNPPLHGAAIVSLILKDQEMRKLWVDELATMRGRVETMRTYLLDALAAQLDSKQLEGLRSAVGMFTLLPLTEAQVERLMKKWALYMTKSGRVNLTGLTPTNLDYVIKAIIETCKEE